MEKANEINPNEVRDRERGASRSGLSVPWCVLQVVRIDDVFRRFSRKALKYLVGRHAPQVLRRLLGVKRGMGHADEMRMMKNRMGEVRSLCRINVQRGPGQFPLRPALSAPAPGRPDLAAAHGTGSGRRHKGRPSTCARLTPPDHRRDKWRSHKFRTPRDFGSGSWQGQVAGFYLFVP